MASPSSLGVDKGPNWEPKVTSMEVRLEEVFASCSVPCGKDEAVDADGRGAQSISKPRPSAGRPAEREEAPRPRSGGGIRQSFLRRCCCKGSTIASLGEPSSSREREGEREGLERIERLLQAAMLCTDTI